MVSRGAKLANKQFEKNQADIQKREREIIALENSAFDNYTTMQYFKAIAVRKSKELKECEYKNKDGKMVYKEYCSEEIEGVQKTTDELLWEFNKLRRQVFNLEMNFIANVEELKRKGVQESEISAFFEQRHITLTFQQPPNKQETPLGGQPVAK